jgi:hypothetical protein
MCHVSNILAKRRRRPRCSGRETAATTLGGYRAGPWRCSTAARLASMRRTLPSSRSVMPVYERPATAVRPRQAGLGWRCCCLEGQIHHMGVAVRTTQRAWGVVASHAIGSSNSTAAAIKRLPSSSPGCRASVVASGPYIYRPDRHSALLRARISRAVTCQRKALYATDIRCPCRSRSVGALCLNLSRPLA